MEKWYKIQNPPERHGQVHVYSRDEEKYMANTKPHKAGQISGQCYVRQMVTFTKSFKLTEGVSSGGAINFW